MARKKVVVAEEPVVVKAGKGPVVPTEESPIERGKRLAEENSK